MSFSQTSVIDLSHCTMVEQYVVCARPPGIVSFSVMNKAFPEFLKIVPSFFLRKGTGTY